MDLLTSKVFSKLTLSKNFRLKLFLNKGVRVTWFKINNSKIFFSKRTSRLITLQF